MLYVKGTGFSPYIKTSKINAGFSPEGMLVFPVTESEPSTETKMTTPDLTEKMKSVLARMKEMALTAPSLDALEKGMVEAIAEQLSGYDWVGFYMLDPEDRETLVLGRFVGEPTAHVRIPVTEGICGAAVSSGETVIVDDVNADPRYLSCSISTKSEIVVPIYVQGKIVGELDIDSHAPAAFTDVDRKFLEEMARVVGAYVEKHSHLPL
jgi:GAF domain-containing protein